MGDIGEIYRFPAQDELTRLLECPICNEVSLPPLFNCNNGHLICGSCIKNLSQCGICRAPLSTVRNFALESIVNSSSFKCKFENDGCPQRIRGELYKSHIDACDFRTVLCNHSTVKKCNDQEISIHSFVDHLINVHKLLRFDVTRSQTLTIVEMSSNLEAQLWPQLCILKQNKWFFRRQCLKDGILQVWITHLGNDLDAAGFQAEIKIKNESEQNKMQVTWCIPVHSFRKSIQDVQASGMVAVIPAQQLKHIATKTNEVESWKWSATYSIKNITS